MKNTSNPSADIRKQKLLSGLNRPAMIGLEIGALCRPFIKPEDGPVIYVDHANTEQLKEKYRDHPDVDVNDIVEVNAIWGTNTLKEALGNKKVDYVVASHVIEHVPDLIGWLGELRSVLNPSGEVRLIVPDKRFTFDHFRAETRIDSVVHCNLIGARVPQPNIVIDYCMHVAKLDPISAWRHAPKSEEIERHHDIGHARRIARDIIENGSYHDVHCWVFTPKSFASLFRKMAELDLIDFACTNFHDTLRNEIEFFVGLEASNDKDKILKSWEKMESLASEHVPGESFWRIRRTANRILSAINPINPRSFEK